MSSNALQTLSNDLTAVVEHAGPAVVAIQARPRIASSGVIWRPGIVVTAAHTIRRDGEVSILLADGKTVTGKPAGRDGATDIAVYRLGDSTGRPAEIATSGAKVGGMVVQVGRTGNTGPSATLGLIHAIHSDWRTWRGAAIEQVFELDLPVRDGFSGSPLLDSAGRVLGLNTSRLARGSSFALPAAVVNGIVDVLLAKGRIPRGYLGVGLQRVALPAKEGARALMVLSVDPDAPAGKAGIILGDVIVKADGDPIADIWDLAACLSPERVGSSVELELLRGGESRRLRVSIGERPAA